MTFIHPVWLLAALPAAACLILWRAPSFGILILRTAILALAGLGGIYVYNVLLATTRMLMGCDA